MHPSCKNNAHNKFRVPKCDCSREKGKDLNFHCTYKNWYFYCKTITLKMPANLSILKICETENITYRLQKEKYLEIVDNFTLIPVFVASLTASKSLSYFGL